MDIEDHSIVIYAEIGGHDIHKTYVDGGSASEILYEHFFLRLRPEVRRNLVPKTMPLIGFSREISWPLGQILLRARNTHPRGSPIYRTWHDEVSHKSRNNHYYERKRETIRKPCVMTCGSPSSAD
ncbi:hypothetical protein Tco_0659346 [Tanacetum coccineum]